VRTAEDGPFARFFFLRNTSRSYTMAATFLNARLVLIIAVERGEKREKERKKTTDAKL
jgi:hypothetical protein